MHKLRVVIADDEPIILLDLRQMLEELGISVVGEASDGRQAVEKVRQLKPDLAILDIKMPEMDGIEAARILHQERLAPVLILTAYSDRELIERAKQAGVYGYLVKPFKQADLMPAIEIALSRYHDTLELEQQVNDLKDALETRKIIERAKGILMDTYGLREQEAYRRIQVQSMNTRKSMREIAEAIIIAHTIQNPSQ
ncbi:MAG: response regulator [Armatimonadetes bacterium]|nr:response regulator [Armatimonadota bacterium]CUU11229.1 response regulator receiver and ANTAR domain protein [Armatimonadetes bacterium GBS]CUU35253.1 response regulator receiver and ANTAR domain protein [Armatimonadetes bacterium GXS]CUU37281.1 response regulator receiver and ANTAR domain protein [Armatimonadetes bacterium DC]GBC91299.1 putative transcriptional regulatory protein pdtaR [bacterium HR14]GIV14124.1 MAG: Fis family transcriptional regulator [Fimbriimonadales bacterium]